MKILVTGGLGFIGSHLVEALLQRKDVSKIYVIDDLSGVPYEQKDLTTIFPFLLDDRVYARFTKISLALYPGFREDIQEIYHFAAYAAENLSHHIRTHNTDVNIRESEALINFAVNNNVPVFHFASSAAVYGHIYSGKPVYESDTPCPSDPYGLSKLYIENSLAMASRYFGYPLSITCWRMHNVIGERQNLLDPFRNVASIFIRQRLNQDPLSIFGDGSQTRQFTDVKMVANVIANHQEVVICGRSVGKSTSHPPINFDVFNIGTDLQTRILDLAQLISPNLAFLEARNEVQHVVTSHIKLLSRVPTGRLKQRSLETLVVDMVRWAKENFKYTKKQEIPFLEIANKLPTSWANLYALTKRG